MLGQRDFARAHQSLQLDETIAVYAAQILGDASHLGLVNNRHPFVPLSGMGAGHRLVVHGLGTEILHAVLAHHKHRNQQTTADGNVSRNSASSGAAPMGIPIPPKRERMGP